MGDCRDPEDLGEISMIHRDEGTHYCCQNRLDKEGGKARCCSCFPHPDCGMEEVIAIEKRECQVSSTVKWEDVADGYYRFMELYGYQTDTPGSRVALRYWEEVFKLHKGDIIREIKKLGVPSGRGILIPEDVLE